MSDGKWSGGIANRNWARPGSRYAADGMTAPERTALFESVADASFLCDTCNASHPLREHQACRDAEIAAAAAYTATRRAEAHAAHAVSETDT